MAPKAAAAQSAITDPSKLVSAAMEGYNVPDDEVQDEKGANEELVLIGDDALLSANQKRVVAQLKESGMYSKIKIKRIALSFSGASVYFFSPMRKDGTPMPSSVLKLDTAECVRDEVGLTAKYGALFGLTTPKVKDVQFLEGTEPSDPSAVMQIDLCGGVFGLPEFASAPPVLTFAQVLEEEFANPNRKIDMAPLINEALERRMHAFTISERTVKKTNLASMYKLTRFVGHGVLNRAKEGKKRLEKSPALAAGFLNPADVDDLDPEGNFMRELTGARKTAKDFFNTFVGHEELFGKKFEREVILGLCHNDLHGGNLLSIRKAWYGLLTLLR